MMNWLDGLDSRWDGGSIPKEHWHFHRRLWDRYSIVLEPGEFRTILSAIETGVALAVEQQGKKRVVYSVYLKARNERIYVVAAGNRLVTVLKPRRRLNELRRQAHRDRQVERKGADEA